MKLFCMDLHISVIADFKSANPDIEVVDWCLSGHAWVMKRQQDYPEHINSDTWKDLTVNRIEKFQDTYDSFLKTFDGFIVGYCSSFAMIYEKYNKPILMLNAVRYDIPFCWTQNTVMLLKWKECIDRLQSHKLLIIVSNNKADQLYTKLGCGLDSTYIPSLCLYTKTTYTPTKATFLAYSGSFSNHPLLTAKKDLPHPHEWSDITSFRGVIHFPYDVSLMSLFEQFTAGCPLFFPSKSYWKANPSIQSISAYWGDRLPAEFYALSTQQAWIELADMYDVFQSPNTYYYESEQHLFHMLEAFEYKDDREFRNARIENVKKDWKLVLQSIVSNLFWEKHPRHMCYNRLPLLANVVYDTNYDGSGVTAQHSYPYKESFTSGDVVFVKTDFLSWFLQNKTITAPIILVTGVSDKAPTQDEHIAIVSNPYIRKWVGCNIPYQHSKIVKLPIGVGEPERPNGHHDTLVSLHSMRIPWHEKQGICIPYHGDTHGSRRLIPTLPKLEFREYMKAIGQHKFVVCQRGNGIDTHRVCEVLLMGSVPVLEHSDLDDMYCQWPVLIVESFQSINTNSFVFDPIKYESFLDVFWIRNMLKERLL